MGRGAGTRAAWRLVLLLLVASVRATRRFVNVNGAVEAADDVTRANVLQSPRAPVACDDTAVGDTCATLSKSRIDMETLMDAGFIEMYASSVSAPLAKGYGTVGTDRSSQRGGHNGKSNFAFAKRRDEDRSGLDLQNGRANPLSARADGSAKVEDLSLAEEAYLYDDVFLEDGTVLNEDDFPTVERHKSRTGWDEPSWDALETQWDDLPGISRRAEHLPGFTEPESEKRLIGGMKPSLVRDAMQRKLLELGRGNPIMFGTWGHLGNAFRLMGESHAAVQSLRRALYLKPDDKDALTHLAIVLRDAGYTADAAKIFQYVISLGSATALVHYLLGNQLIELGEPEAALANFQIWLGLNVCIS
ncbi:UDP-N-acetylglucosamine--peptide N-acetylglucosaminyltransferase 110 kDa subunit [Hondaea fermentalgiana]|uniref:UDP-N-acetylglucosamine--peptide N-acetylglucosaminyltransferase 110 kDa subunit n=1 Tax=Hondaea fermentalgiana TaxID=2315210 RepID=A0A2R5FZF8_9STRA|nr:UDP-N-acetylglucosamine--peptide N-acetylglucosaminyltransferase 110 kDa subunit [Hondaea fermentalgiana]|eukprot:GBG24110.1 UDP-N-acetylglucosamine--peptide N-acetylglucosaminyltransferase 110 kDa subunit [Hondaea fermentalgiana]